MQFLRFSVLDIASAMLRRSVAFLFAAHLFPCCAELCYANASVSFSITQPCVATAFLCISFAPLCFSQLILRSAMLFLAKPSLGIAMPLRIFSQQRPFDSAPGNAYAIRACAPATHRDSAAYPRHASPWLPCATPLPCFAPLFLCRGSPYFANAMPAKALANPR